MTKVTISKLGRKYEATPLGTIVGEREKVQDPFPRRFVGNCVYCTEPVYVVEGQFLKFFTNKQGEREFSHKACRKTR